LLLTGVHISAHQPRYLWVDLADHRPDGRDLCLQHGGIRAFSVGVKLVYGLSHAPECSLPCRTHGRRLSARRCARTPFPTFSYPQPGTASLWIRAVDNLLVNRRQSISSAQPVDYVSPGNGDCAGFLLAVSTTLSPGCAQLSRRVAHVVHNVIHRRSWCRACQAAKMSEPSARTVSGFGRNAFAPRSLTGPRHARGHGETGRSGG